MATNSAHDGASKAFMWSGADGSSGMPRRGRERASRPGRRVIANIERVAKLFVTKTVYAAIIAMTVGVAGVTYPFSRAT